jgi:hypothetical protein
MKLGYRVTVTGGREALAELAEVINTARRPYLVAGCKCLECHAARLFNLSRGHVRVG